MGKLSNTFKHGDKKTKAVLFLMVVGLFLGVAFLIFSILMQNNVLTFIAVTLLIADIGYIFSARFSDVNDQVQAHVKEKKGRKQASSAGSASSAKGNSDNEDAEPAALEWISSKRKKADKKSASESVDKTSTEKINNTRDSVLKDNPLLSIDESKMKKIMHKYKVKKEHVAILIDNYREKDVYECPAILWKDKTFAYILLLEEAPRMLKFSLYDYRELHINASVPCYPSREYAVLQQSSFIGLLYKPLLPNYRTAEGSARSAFKKSLYGIGPDIFCTSGSVQNILKVLSLELVLTESKINKENYGKYFREVYCARLLYRDSVYNGQQYKDKVLSILGNMARNADSDNEFAENLSQMLLNSLIPQEYADYATQMRKKSR